MRALHTFAGAGGSVIAGRILGWRSVGAVEIDPFCCAVLEHHGERVLARDIRGFDAAGLGGMVDLVVGGWPCQGNSVAGKRLGLTDDRSNLWWQLHRVLGECQAPFLFAENVRGALSVNAGRDFGTILRSLDDLGYDARWTVNTASSVGAPHKRERLWLFAWKRGVVDPDRVSGDGWADLAWRSAEGRAAAGRASAAGELGDCRDVAHAGGNADERLRDTGGVRCACGAVEGGEGLPQQRALGGRREDVGHTDGERREELHVATVAVDAREHLAERDVADAGEPRLQGGDGSERGDEPRQHRAGCDVGDPVCGGGQGQPVSAAGNSDETGSACHPRGPSAAERGMGRADHGLAERLGDWPARRGLWPAGRGSAQYPWEAPRVVTQRKKGDLKALKALGNGWVPQQAVAAWWELTEGILW